MTSPVDLGVTINNAFNSTRTTFTSSLRYEYFRNNSPPEAQDHYGPNNSSVFQFVQLGINPEKVEFIQPKRITEQKLQEGSVFYHFANNQGQNNDILRMTFSGSTGDISGADGESRDNLRQWRSLYLLTQEPMRLWNGRENVFSIAYVSPTFEVKNTFRGFFETVLKLDEDANMPNERLYNFTFVVTSVNRPVNLNYTPL